MVDGNTELHESVEWWSGSKQRVQVDIHSVYSEDFGTGEGPIEEHGQSVISTSKIYPDCIEPLSIVQVLER